MRDGRIIFDILDYWHAGAGHGGGRKLDAVVRRSPAGLPIIPGRTVRGLLRDVVRQSECFGALEQGTTETVFGSELESRDRFETREGLLRLSTAELPGDWETYAQTHEGRASLDGFFCGLSNTAIGNNGQVVDHSLRHTEVAIPLELVATWHVREASAHTQAFEVLTTAAPLLRAFGRSRHRGLGRVEIRVERGGAA
jgi:hypothetical protein